MYEVRIGNKPEKFLKQLQPDYRETIKARLQELKTTIFPRGAINLEGKPHCYRIRVGPFRIQYQVYEAEKVVLIYKIERRDETTYR